MEFDFGIDKKSNVKSGRRAKPKQSNSRNTNQKESKTNSKSQECESENTDTFRPSRRTAGWGDSERKQSQGNPVEDERLTVDNDGINPNLDDEEDNLQVIPELDDVQEDLSQQMAAPPSIAMNKVATYRELNNDLYQQSSFTHLDEEIDMKLLTKHLSLISEIQEKDETWDWDKLFAQVSSTLKFKS